MFLVRRRPFTSKGTMLVLVAGSKMTVVGVVRSGWNFFFFLSCTWKEELTCLPNKPNMGKRGEGAVKVSGQSG